MTILQTLGLAAFAVLAIYLLIRLLAAPIRGLLKLLLHMGTGLLLLFLVNLIGGFFNFYIPYTLPTVLISGIGGAPGVILLILSKLLW